MSFPVRVLLDANVWLAALACDGFCRRVVEAAAPSCVRVTTPILREEVREKLIAKFKLTPEQSAELVSSLAARTWCREDPSFDPVGLNDPDDEPILAAAVTHACEALVIGDKGLLVLGAVRGVRILTVRAFAGWLGLEVGWASRSG